MADAPIMTLEQFARKHGLITDADVQGHIHAGLRSAPTTKTYARWNAAKLAELQQARDATRAAYNEAISRGEIRKPDYWERIEAKANGHDDNPSVQAARRLLQKRRTSA